MLLDMNKKKDFLEKIKNMSKEDLKKEIDKLANMLFKIKLSYNSSVSSKLIRRKIASAKNFFNLIDK